MEDIDKKEVPMEETVNTPVEEAVQKAAYKDKHTAKNTTMKDFVEHEDVIKGPIPEELRERAGYISIPLGSKVEDYKQSTDLIHQWLTFETTRSRFEEEGGTRLEEAYKKALNDFRDYGAENFPNLSPEDLSTRASELYSFMSQLLDEPLLRNKVLQEEKITNVSNRGSGHITPDVVGRVPNRSTKGFKASELMVRATTGANKDKLNFDVLLRDSFVHLSFTRPSRLEMGSLINDIHSTVKGYVRDIGGNHLTLARIATAKVIWQFISRRIVNCSVSDISDYESLSRVIRFKDIEKLAIALIEAYSTKGIHLQLSCLNKDCDWSDFKIVDPSRLANIRTSIITDEQHAIFANLFNGNVKYTVEETLNLSKENLFGNEANDLRVYNGNKSVYFKLGQPTLAQAFNAFDGFIADFNPKLDDLRQVMRSPEEYDSQVSYLFNSIGSTEYLHWITEFVRLPDPDTDEETLRITRDDSEDEMDFNRGLMSVISEDPDLNKELVSKVLTKVPSLSFNFFGVRNYKCPGCGTNQREHVEELMGEDLGYTPIDPVMAFFILTQLKLIETQVELSEAKAKALS